MEIEKLNKSQILLLTLLVSFVTSITTGIVTVSLMDQAPPAITQTVNRIVERTVEKVIPSTQPAAAIAAVATPEKTVVLREGDLIAKSIQGIESSIVRLYAPGDADGKPITIFMGLGIVSNSSGVLLADSSSVPAPENGVTVMRSDGVRVPVSVIGRDKTTGIITLQAATSTEVKKDDGTTETKSLVWNAATFSSDTPKLGSTVVSLSGKISTHVAQGIVTAITPNIAEGSKDSALVFVDTSIPEGSFSLGSPLINVDGQVIGLSTKGSLDSGGFLASSAIVLYNNKTKEESAASAASPDSKQTKTQ